MDFGGFGGFYPQGQTDLFPQMHDETMQKQMTVTPDLPPPPPVVICPTEVDHINVTLEKNQQCACKDCGKLFNSVWYLKQHAVKHSNDRPFKCKFCFKTYKFRSNLYQHKCPDRQKSGGQGGRRLVRNMTLPTTPTTPVVKMQENQENHTPLPAITAIPPTGHMQGPLHSEEDEIPYGLVIRMESSDLVTSPAEALLAAQAAAVAQQPSPPQRPSDSIRPLPLQERERDEWMGRNKNKLLTCRRCRLMFPSSEALERHSSVHSREDEQWNCQNCPQSFETERELRRHSTIHSPVGPWKCNECAGVFRSNYALRRHRDACRECYYYPFGEEPAVIPSPAAPLDPYSFIVSEADQLIIPTAEELNKKGPDSGLGSDHSAAHSFTTSPARTMEEEYDVFLKRGTVREKEDDEESGFRSRLNSVTQSCSPGSSTFSSDVGSPMRKHSHTQAGGHGGMGHEMMGYESSSLGSFGAGTNYGQQLFHNFEGTVGGNQFGDMDMGDCFSLDSSVDMSVFSPSSSQTVTLQAVQAKHQIRRMQKIASPPVVFPSSSVDVDAVAFSFDRFDSIDSQVVDAPEDPVDALVRCMQAASLVAAVEKRLLGITHVSALLACVAVAAAAASPNPDDDEQ